jgi:uncharacterized protein
VKTDLNLCPRYSGGLRMRLIIVLLVLVLCLGSERPTQKRLAVLIVDGINNHDWEAGTRAAKAILAATGRFTVDVSTTKYQAVLVNFNGGHKEDGIRWPTAVEQALEQYVRAGGGLIVLHAANNAFLQWAAWNEMIGLGWRDKSFGPGLVVVDGKVATIARGTGLNPGHGPRHDFQMCVFKRNHPITRGSPNCWLHPSEQLTHGQHGPAEGLTVLTYAYSKDSKQNEPLDWVRNYEKGRVYTTMLGHTWKDEANPNLECVAFQTLLARGVEWAASGRVTIPLPPDFPTAQKVARRPLESLLER